MKIYTSYFGNYGNLIKAGVVPVSIARYSPKWYYGIEFKFLAPSSALLNNKNLTDKEYNNIYQREVLEKIDVENLKKKIYIVSKGKPVALLCYEKDWNYCHRKCVAEWLIRKGVEVTEFETKEKVRQFELFE